MTRAAPPRVTLFDYGAGNLHSLAKALEAAGAAVRVEPDPARAVADTDALILPGVGAFATAADRLAPGLAEVRDALGRGLPCLGICLGMQLLFEASEESPGARGLGYIRGQVRRLPTPKLPQIGWNTLACVDGEELFEGLPEGPHVYYVNSFAPKPEEPVTIATTTYGETFTAAVRKRLTWGVQFHPEKSGPAGLAMVRNFVRQIEEQA